MHFKAVEREGRVEGALLIVSDITRQVQARRIELMQREQLKVFERVLNDRIGFLVFFQEARAIVERIFENAFPGNDECLRAVHTLKGNCAIFDVTTVAPIAHRLEQAIVDDESELRDKELQNLGAAWDQLREIRHAVG
jgi:two-component system chemotaxis sensor kinase CheA